MVEVLRFGEREVVCLLRRAAAARLLSVSLPTLDRLAETGKLPQVMVNHHPRYRLDDLLAFIERNRGTRGG